MASESLKAFLFGMVKESGKNGEAIQLPETPSTGDQEHGGTAGGTGGNQSPIEERGPQVVVARNEPTTRQEEAQDFPELEAFRRASPKEPPMIAPGMPDYAAFCGGYWRECDHCPHYVNSGTGLFCSMWEAVYPGRVTWYPMA